MIQFRQIKNLIPNMLNFIPRIITAKSQELLKKFPIISITGPRQAGKTTLIQNIFSDKPYISLEDPDMREFALSDPRSFLEKYSDGCILDEVQKVPELFSYLQTFVDQDKKLGKFILSGSQNFLLNENISQSLAGRVGILRLSTFSIEEINVSLQDNMFRGGYPPLYDLKRNLEPKDWFWNYIETYLERDVRNIINVSNLRTFQTFLKICAGRVGQVINYSNIANDCGITQNTVKSWLSLLESSYIIFFLPPYYKNFKKRLTKSPKIYFYDTGLLSYLLGIRSKDQIDIHFAKGHIFESFVFSEIMKFFYNRGIRPDIYFFRDKNGNEVDGILEYNTKIYPIEIKAGKTISQDYFKGLNFFSKISKNPLKNNYLIYAGNDNQKRKYGNVYNLMAFLKALKNM